MQLYNTLTGKKESFIPKRPGHAGVYACGITVYDDCHLGHARTYMATDVLVRYLRFRGLQVHYVRNITDIDDKIIKRANENQEDFAALTQRYIQAMHDDFKTLGLLSPDDEPRATEYIAQMIRMIEKIIANQHAYVGENGDVYFDVRSFAPYGCLSHHDIEQLESGARVEISEVKRDPLDFVLWKSAKPNEPSWDSPWGKGRPGWHIECSVMSTQLLGEHFDIHAGGRDLIFPHHENENAQTQAALNTQFVNIWMHAGLLQVGKEKMSKSLGNFIILRDALRTHSPEVLRYFLIASHYRSPVIYTDETLLMAKQSLSRFYTALRSLPASSPVENSSFEKEFIAAMDDDLNTPLALSILFELSHEIQRLREKDMQMAAAHGALLGKLGSIIGILQMDAEAFFQSGQPQETISQIEALIAARQQARKEKNWVEADRLRKTLLEMNVVLEDTANTTTWKWLDTP